MVNKYDIMERLIILSEYTGKLIVWIVMLAGCILLWYLVFSFIF